MAIPTRAEAAAILAGLHPNDKLLTHSSAVAEVAAFLCSVMVRRGVAVNTTLVETAALLHDLDKALPDKDPLKPLGHARAGAEWLRRHDLAELADAVEAHPVMELGSAATYEAWAHRAGLSGRIVTYADKRARQDLLALDERFEKWHGQYPDSPALDLAHHRGRQLEAEICKLAGLRSAEVQRLAWVAEAMRTAA